jgi:hypothetical protein
MAMKVMMNNSNKELMIMVIVGNCIQYAHSQGLTFIIVIHKLLWLKINRTKNNHKNELELE